MKCVKKNKNTKFISIEDVYNKEKTQDNFETKINRSKHIDKKYTTYHEDVKCVYCLNYHNGKKCDLQLCRWCNDIGHSSSRCKRLSDPDRITLCRCFKNTYHSVNDCPQTWRLYKIKKRIDYDSIIKSCSNCSSNKHFTNDCVKEQNKFSIFNSEYLQDFCETLNDEFEKQSVEKKCKK